MPLKTVDPKDIMQAIAGALDDNLNGPCINGKREGNTGFVVLLFDMNAIDGTEINYVSNTERASTLVALKELVARFEGQPVQQGRV